MLLLIRLEYLALGYYRTFDVLDDSDFSRTERPNLLGILFTFLLVSKEGQINQTTCLYALFIQIKNITHKSLTSTTIELSMYIERSYAYLNSINENPTSFLFLVLTKEEKSFYIDTVNGLKA